MTKIINLGTSAFYELQEATKKRVKKMKKKIRKYISVRLIELLWRVLPKGKFKSEFAKFILKNIFEL